MSNPPSFFKRLFMAPGVFFRTLFQAEFADSILNPAPKLAPPEPEKALPPPTRANTDSALQLLGQLQREGRLIDFLHEDVSEFSDEDIGAAARVVHAGCKKALEGCVSFASVRDEEEGSEVTLKSGFDPNEIELVGKVAGDPPFKGSLAHKGWKVTDVSLPKVTDGHDLSVIAKASIEL